MKEIFEKVESEICREIDQTRFLIVGNARWRRSVYLFAPFDSKPFLLLKMPANDEAQHQCDVEYKGICYISSSDIPNIVTPRPMGSIKHKGRICYLQNVVESNLMLNSIAEQWYHPKNTHFVKITGHLVDIYQKTKHEEKISGKSFSRCYQHGDFWAGNIGIKGSKIVLYDFEYADENGFPLMDLLHFGLYYIIAMGNKGRIATSILKTNYRNMDDRRKFEPSREDIKTLLLDGDHVSRIMRKCIESYISRCGIRQEDAIELIKEYVEGSRGISGLIPGWERTLL